VVLSSEEVEDIDIQVLEYVKSSRQKEIFISQADIDKYRQMRTYEETLAKKVALRKKHKLQQDKKREKERKGKLDKKEEKGIIDDTSKEAEHKQNKEEYSKKYYSEQPKQTTEEYDKQVFLLLLCNVIIKLYAEFCAKSKTNDQELTYELTQLKQLIGTMREPRDGGENDEFTYKEIKEILHIISTTGCKDGRFSTEKCIETAQENQKK